MRFLALASMFLAGCFRPDFSGGELSCGVEGECPPGFECGGDGLCHAEGDGDGDTPDAGQADSYVVPLPDASPDAPVLPEECQVEPDYPDLGDFDVGQVPYEEDTLYGAMRFWIDLGGGDQFHVAFFDGFGVFTGGYTTGDFAIDGAEMYGHTCGICIYMVGNGAFEQLYFANGGQVSLESVEGRLVGALRNVHLGEATIELEGNWETNYVDDGCESSVDGMDFDLEIVYPE